MPRYYRHIRQGEYLIQDPEGIELTDLDAARAEAIDGIRDLLAEAIRRGRDDWLLDAIVITDGVGQELMTVPFSEALPPSLYKAFHHVLCSNLQTLESDKLGESQNVSSADRQT